MSVTVRRARFLLTILIGFVAYVLVFPPVGWLAERVGRFTDERLSISGVQGTLWQGQAQFVLFDGNLQRAIPGWLRWQVQPLALIKPDLPLLTIEHPVLPTAISVQRMAGQFTVSGGQAVFPANWLEATGAPWNTLRPGGSIRLAWSAFQPGQPVRVTLRWEDAQSALSMVKPLGNYEVLADIAADGSMSAQLQTLSGDLQLEGQARWASRQGFGFSGYASASPAQEAALTGLLSQMGRLENNNRYRLGT